MHGAHINTQTTICCHRVLQKGSPPNNHQPERRPPTTTSSLNHQHTLPGSKVLKVTNTMQTTYMGAVALFFLWLLAKVRQDKAKDEQKGRARHQPAQCAWCWYMSSPAHKAKRTNTSSPLRLAECSQDMHQLHAMSKYACTQQAWHGMHDGLGPAAISWWYRRGACELTALPFESGHAATTNNSRRAVGGGTLHGASIIIMRPPPPGQGHNVDMTCYYCTANICVSGKVKTISVQLHQGHTTLASITCSTTDTSKTEQPAVTACRTHPLPHTCTSLPSPTTLTPL